MNGLWTEKEMTVEAVIEEAGQMVFSFWGKRLVLKKNSVVVSKILYFHHLPGEMMIFIDLCEEDERI